MAKMTKMVRHPETARTHTVTGIIITLPKLLPTPARAMARPRLRENHLLMVTLVTMWPMRVKPTATTTPRRSQNCHMELI